MKTHIFILFLFLNFSNCFSQTCIDSIVQIEINRFEKNGIKNFFFLSNSFSECLQKSKHNCEIETGTIFAFWREGDNDYVQKINKCVTRRKQGSKLAMQFFIDNKTKLIEENIKEYTTNIDTTNGIVSTLAVSHGKFTTIYILEENITIKKEINNFDLSNNLTNPNLLYTYNNSLNLTRLKLICDKFLQKKY